MISYGVVRLRENGRNNSQHFRPAKFRSCWVVLADATTRINVGSCSASCYNIEKLTEFCRLYCDTHELCSKGPRVMRMWSPNNVGRAMQTDPTFFVTLPDSLQPLTTICSIPCKRTQNVTPKNVGVLANNAASVCTKLIILFDLLHSSYHTQPYVTQKFLFDVCTFVKSFIANVLKD